MNVLKQTTTLSEMTLRELVDGIGRVVMTAEGDDIRIGVLHTVRATVKDRITSVSVIAGGEEVDWSEEWKSAVFAW